MNRTTDDLNKQLFFNHDVSDKVLCLFKSKQFEQRTKEWYNARKNCITASDISSALKQTKNSCSSYMKLCPTFEINPKKQCAVYSSKQEFIHKKKFETSFSNKYTEWGQRFERVASNIYAQMNQTDVLELGLIIHPKYPFLAASPDGITPTGTLLEIKCPSTREIKKIPPLHYYHQMLMQMECTGMKECDFFDARFNVYVDEQQWMTEARGWERENPNAKHHIYGLLLERQDDRIFPPTRIIHISDFIKWCEEMNDDNEYNVVRYKLSEYNVCRIFEDKEWIEKNIQELKETWQEILSPTTPPQPQPPRKRRKIKYDKIETSCLL